MLIPCRNAEQWLGEAIRSVLAQTWQDVEIIVVDDASTDNSLQIAKSFSGPRIKVTTNKGCGASAARNEALRHAQGMFIQYLDADDVLAPRKIEAQLARLRETELGVLASSAWAPFRYRTSEATFIAEAVWRDSTPTEFLIQSWSGGGMMPPLVWLTSRDLIEKAGSWNEALTVNDDGEFFARVILRASRIIFCGNALSYYRKSTAATLSSRRGPTALTSAYNACALSCSHLLSVDTSEDARRACATAYQRFAYNTYPEVPNLVKAAEARVAELGGCDLRPEGGKSFRLLAAVTGWKVARRIQLAAKGEWHTLLRPPDGLSGST